MGTLKLKENVESILRLKTGWSPDSKGAHQVINWSDKRNSIPNIHNVFLFNLNKVLNFYFKWKTMLLLVSAIQCESATNIHISLPS